MALGLSTIYGSMFKKVDRYLNLNHLSNCSTISGSTNREQPKADLESGAKPKVVKIISATPTQLVATSDIPAKSRTIRADSATADD
jgi:hypothetical protein